MQRFINPQRFRHVQRLAQFQPPRIVRLASMSAAETDTQAAQAANTSGITPASLTTTLTEALEAKHVDINDISGTSSMSLMSCTYANNVNARWLRPSIRSRYRITTVHEENHTRTASTCQLGSED